MTVAPTVPAGLTSVARRAEGGPEKPSLRSTRTGRRNASSALAPILVT